MISSVALNSLLHHQNTPSSSTANNELNSGAHLLNSDTSTTTHATIATTPRTLGGATTMAQCGSGSGGMVYAPTTSQSPATSPMAYIFSALRHSVAPKHGGEPILKRNHDDDITKYFENITAVEDENEEHKSDALIAETVNKDSMRSNDKEINACESTSPRDEKAGDSQISTSHGMENFLEAQKTLQKLTSQLSGLGQRSPFQNLSAISPFLVAALQQQNIQQQLFAAQQQQQQNCVTEGGSDTLGTDSTSAGDAEKEAATASFLGNSYLNAALPFGAALRFNVHGDVEGTHINDHVTALSTASSARSRNSPLDSAALFSGDEDEELVFRRIEPEDLSLRERRSDIDETGSTAPNNWSWEEQFKQLYELSNEPERREWLNDWLSFMHRIGKPVTRIPIMAKQVLDLYELYRLVVQHGGLVEIINKKLWREITKGLNLPNSITSAAFTLRTQYQKYLYDYECDRENLSCLADLQSAIEGNKREGRRTNPQSDTPGAISVGGGNTNMGGHSILSNTSCSSAAKASNDADTHRRNSTMSFPYGALTPHSMAAFFGKGLGAFSADREELANELSGAFTAAGHSGALPPLAQFEMLQKAALSAAMVARNLGFVNNHRNKGNRDGEESGATNGSNMLKCRSATPPGGVATPAKRARHDSGGYRSTVSGVDSTVAGRSAYLMTRMKLNDGPRCFGSGERESMRISLEVNGQTYEGMLFARLSGSALSVTASAADTVNASISNTVTNTTGQVVEESETNNEREVVALNNSSDGTPIADSGSTE